jgi:hypothetical protein
MKRDAILTAFVAIGTPVLATCSRPGPSEAAITDPAPSPGQVERESTAARTMIIVSEN